MSDFNFDRAIRDTLNETAKGLEAPESLGARVKFAVKNNERPQKHIRGWGKRLVAVCAVAAIAVTGAIAGGGVMSISSHSYHDKAWKNFDETASYAEQYVKDAKYLESFTNGYTFKKGNTETSSKNDENGNSLGLFTGLMLNYEKDGATLLFNAEPVQEELIYTSEYDTVRTIDDVDVSYREMFCIYLPPDGSEKPTAEEQAKFDAGEINIGYGSETREEMTYYAVKWVEDGIHYNISTYDPAGLTEDDFFQMASEVISSESDMADNLFVKTGAE